MQSAHYVTAFYLCFFSKANLHLEIVKDCRKCALEEFTNLRTISDFILARLEGKQAHISVFLSLFKYHYIHPDIQSC